MYSNIETIIYYFIDLLYIENRYVMVTYYVTLFVSLLLNYMPHHIFLRRWYPCYYLCYSHYEYSYICIIETQGLPICTMVCVTDLPYCFVYMFNVFTRII
jgi:hypothetical protein